MHVGEGYNLYNIVKAKIQSMYMQMVWVVAHAIDSKYVHKYYALDKYDLDRYF